MLLRKRDSDLLMANSEMPQADVLERARVAMIRTASVCRPVHTSTEHTVASVETARVVEVAHVQVSNIRRPLRYAAIGV